MIRFNNDYNCGAHPRVIEALAATNEESHPGYGLDEWCERGAQAIRDHAAAPHAAVHFVVGGTQANFLVIASACGPTKASSAPTPGTSTCTRRVPWSMPATRCRRCPASTARSRRRRWRKSRTPSRRAPCRNTSCSPRWSTCRTPPSSARCMRSASWRSCPPRAARTGCTCSWTARAWATGWPRRNPT